MEQQNKSICCGCGACAQICPQNCIVLEEDVEGFRYPVSDKKKCTHCGLCGTVCPALNRSINEFKGEVYAAAAKERELLMRSSSGGMYGILAEYVLDREGVVFGAAFNDNMELVHCAAETREECRRFHGSKYIQSNTENTFVQCRQYLEEGRYVLYTGTPCQIAGLKRCLRKEYENLLAVELICHGAPSPGIWRRYIKELEEKKGEKITDASFRYQDRGWKIFRFQTKYENGSQEVMPGADSPYFAAFLNNLTLRPSCYECRYRIDYSKSDMMIGDFWGVGKYYKNFDELAGVSAVLLLSGKGREVFRKMKDRISCEKSDLSMLTPMNGCIRLSVFPNRNRERLMEAYKNGENLSEALNRYTSNYCWADKNYRIGVWGSYNSRLIVQFLIAGSGLKRTFHYSNSSIVSVMSDKKNFDGEFSGENQYRKEALSADWKKIFREQFEAVTADTDYIVIDMLEERFDLVKCGGTYITKSDAMEEGGYFPEGDIIGQEKLLADGVWNKKMRSFVEMLQSKFSSQQVILTEIYLNESYFDGEKYRNFPDREEIRKQNSLLKRIYGMFTEYWPAVHHIRLENKYQYSEYRHRYGCIPPHLNYEACFKLADGIYDIMGKNDE